jgi:enoyl-CoA hydratase
VAPLVTYELKEGVASVGLDDGKVNALSLSMQAELHAALDRAQSDAAVVVLAGRPGRFSAGFDLTTLRAGGPDAAAMLEGGFELYLRLLSFPEPVVMACTGHAVAAGLFLLACADFRIGALGDYRLVANEVAIGMTMPRTVVALLAQRVPPSHLTRVVALAETFSPSDAVGAGLLDRVVEADALLGEARRVAVGLEHLDRPSFRRTKARLRADGLAALRAALDVDLADFRRPARPG